MGNIEILRSKLENKTPINILNNFDIKEVPIDIRTIITRYLDIDIDETLNWDKLALDGSVYLKNGYPEIWINKTMPETRQNFTLAHELGHIVNDILPNIEKYDMPINDNYETLYRGKISNTMEIKANNFAAQILMPSIFINKEAKKLIQADDFNEFTIKQVIQRMADRFRVSYDAMKWRLINLGYAR